MTEKVSLDRRLIISFKTILLTKLGLVDNLFILAQRTQMQADLSEVDADLVYIVRYRTARAILKTLRQKRIVALWHTPLIPALQRKKN